ncbi:hypothetical protein JW898_02105 [Candidatus Woesearchaeota archaeon]|nr:hypothetical protein [Candidatus Woesearchaeota archaeon]
MAMKRRPVVFALIVIFSILFSPIVHALDSHCVTYAEARQNPSLSGKTDSQLRAMGFCPGKETQETAPEETMSTEEPAAAPDIPQQDIPTSGQGQPQQTQSEPQPDYDAMVEAAFHNVPQDRTEEGYRIYKQYYDDNAKDGSSVFGSALSDPEKDRCINGCDASFPRTNVDPDTFHNNFYAYRDCADKCFADSRARTDKLWADLHEREKQRALNAVAALNALAGGAAGAGAGQTQPGTTPGTTTPTLHPLLDFGSSFQPLHFSPYQMNLLNSGMHNYNSKCKGGARAADCDQRVADIMANSDKTFQLHDIAKADNPKAALSWTSAQTVNWAGPDIVDLTNLHLENGDQAGAGVLAWQMMERSRTEQETLFWDPQMQRIAQQNAMANNVLLGDVARRAEQRELEKSATYQALSYDLGTAVGEAIGAHVDAFRISKAMMLANKDTASGIFRALTGGLSEPFVIAAQATEQVNK